MVYRIPPAAPQSQVPADRRGRLLGRFCLVCASLYPLHRATHSGRPVYGRDHIASPCAHEGDLFAPGESWWEPGVEVLPPPPAAPPTKAGESSAPAPGAAAPGAVPAGGAAPSPAPPPAAKP